MGTQEDLPGADNSEVLHIAGIPARRVVPGDIAALLEVPVVVVCLEPEEVVN